MSQRDGDRPHLDKSVVDSIVDSEHVWSISDIGQNTISVGMAVSRIL